MKRLIMICGAKGVGKDTVAKYFINNHGYERLAFADKLKDVCSLLFDIDREIFDDPILKEKEIIGWEKSPRRIMQFIGTEIFQEKINELFPFLNKCFWAIDIKKKIINSKSDNFVISDLRFIHELEIFSDMKPFIIKVVNNKQNDSLHTSELEYNNIIHNIIVHNDGDVDELYEKLKNISQIIEDYQKC